MGRVFACLLRNGLFLTTPGTIPNNFGGIGAPDRPPFAAETAAEMVQYLNAVLTSFVHYAQFTVCRCSAEIHQSDAS
ncbi:MAG: hypothetical protein M9965_20720 [Anaerolineae bacterium]|nr:hypothetical protein [Anaerolineae bacterium]